MNSAATLPDSFKAHEYFARKMDYTTGPVELNRELPAGAIVVVDVRAPEDYRKGHIPGAINLPQGTWQKPPGLDRTKLNVVYCYAQACHLAAAAALEFTAQGYPVKELEGGFEGWKSNDLSVEKSAAVALESAKRLAASQALHPLAG